MADERFAEVGLVDVQVEADDCWGVHSSYYLVALEPGWAVVVDLFSHEQGDYFDLFEIFCSVGFQLDLQAGPQHRGISDFKPIRGDDVDSACEPLRHDFVPGTVDGQVEFRWGHCDVFDGGCGVSRIMLGAYQLNLVNIGGHHHNAATDIFDNCGAGVHVQVEDCSGCIYI